MTNEPILVVDDMPANRRLLDFMLSSQGHVVRTAASAQETLAAVKQERPWLILMDMQLPGMDGFELTRQLKADPSTRDIVIVAVTALAMGGDEVRARSAGCDDYLTKPVDKGLLRTTVARHLAGRKRARDPGR
jgi:two-component system, cell cycle response regulator DivK